MTEGISKLTNGVTAATGMAVIEREARSFIASLEWFQPRSGWDVRAKGRHQCWLDNVLFYRRRPLPSAF